MHADEDTLLQLTLGTLEAGAAAAVQAHLAECADCRRRHASLSSLAFSKTAAGSSGAGEPTRRDGAGEHPGADLPALQRGATLGRYVLLEKLGAGGMGEVFAAYDPHLDRKVALKLLRSGALSAQEGKARLLREAQAMARLQHPNVIAVHDVGTLGDRVFIAMEFVDGETLAEWLRGQHPWEEVVRIFLLAGEGLAAAHRAGLVHRDFKPENVLLGADLRPRVVDFGLARQATNTPTGMERAAAAELELGAATLASPLTRDGAIMGTPGYMPPEQLSGLPTDARSDQFSFCVALWEGLFGKRPFAGASLKQHAEAITRGELTPPPANTPVPDAVVRALKRGLAADPAGRWPDMPALLRALKPSRERSARASLFVVGLVAFSALGIGYGVWTRQRLMLCGGHEKRLAGTWDLQTRARLRDAFAGTGLSYAPASWASVERTLDAWAAEWVGTAREVCEASKLRRIDGPELAALKESCLDERLARMKALVGLFEAPDRDVVNNAPTAARALEPAGTCATASALDRRVLTDEQERAEGAKLHAAIAEARALLSSGKYAAGAERLKQGLSPAAPTAAAAEAYLLLSRLELKRGEPRLAQAAALQSAEHALKGGDPGVLARALSRLYANEGYDQPDTDADADMWKRLAEAAAARVPGDWEVQVELLQNDALVNIRRKRFKAALADYQQALALQRQHLGSEHPEVATTLNNLGVVLTHLQELAEAVASYEESLRLHEALEGPEHPNVALANHNLAVALRQMGRHRDVRAAYARAIDIRRKALGFAHPDTQRSALQLATLEVNLRELEAAQALLDELKAVRAGRSGDDAVELLPIIELETRLFLEGEYWQEALASATRQVALARRGGAAGERGLTQAILAQALAQVGLGNATSARRGLTEAQRRLALGGSQAERELLLELHGCFELVFGSPAEAVSLLTALAKERETHAPLSLAKTHLLLARARLAVGDAEAAIQDASLAEVIAVEAQAERLQLDAQVQRAQLVWLHRPDERAAAAELLEDALKRLPEGRAEALRAWLRAHPASPDAGAP